MSIVTKYYYGSPGSYDIIDPELVNTEVFTITRSGSVYNQGAPVQGLVCAYQNAFGRILFGTPFNGPPPDEPISILQMEKVSVKFRQ